MKKVDISLLNSLEDLKEFEDIFVVSLKNIAKADWVEFRNFICSFVSKPQECFIETEKHGVVKGIAFYPKDSKTPFFHGDNAVYEIQGIEIYPSMKNIQKKGHPFENWYGDGWIIVKLRFFGYTDSMSVRYLDPFSRSGATVATELFPEDIEIVEIKQVN